MSAADKSSQFAEFRCPEEKHPISRAVHLARLAAFYPGCRQCSHREDTGTLSPRQVEQWQEVVSHGSPRALFHDEGAGGVHLNELTPAAARNIATAFGVVLQRPASTLPSPFGKGAEATVPIFAGTAAQPWSAKMGLSPSRQPNPQSPIPNPSILLASDGRALTAELTAAVGEGLRFSGCDVIDIGPATAACLAFAVAHLNAAGGILVGNPSREAHWVGLQFWQSGSRPLSAGRPLEAIAAMHQAGVDRPARQYGFLSRAAADAPYLAAVGQHYHALRPLRIVVDSASGPLLKYLQQLTTKVACHVIPTRATRHELPQQVRADGAHFAVSVDGDGETCEVLDEQGRVVSAGQLLGLLVQSVLGDGQNQDVCVILEGETSPELTAQLERAGVGTVLSGVRRAELAAAMRQHDALLGGGPSGRFWHCIADVPLPDALMTITRLLVVLSRSDEPLSAVLDRNASLD